MRAGDGFEFTSAVSHHLDQLLYVRLNREPLLPERSWDELPCGGSHAVGLETTPNGQLARGFDTVSRLPALAGRWLAHGHFRLKARRLSGS
jgi:hypothetical protein